MPTIKGNPTASGSKLPCPLSILDQPNRIYRPLRAYSANQATPRALGTSTKNRVLKAHTKNHTLVQMRKFCNSCASTYPCRSRSSWKPMLRRRKISTKMMSVEGSAASKTLGIRPNQMIPPKNIAAMDDLIKKRKRLMKDKHWFAKPEDVRYKILYVKTSEPRHQQSPQVIEQPPIMALKKRFQAERILKARQENGEDSQKADQITEEPELADMRRSIMQSNAHPKRRYDRILPRGRPRSHLYRERVQPPVISYAECMKRNDWGSARHTHSQAERSAKLKEKSRQLAYESVQHHFKLRKDDGRSLVSEFEGPAAVKTNLVKTSLKPLMRPLPSTTRTLVPRYAIRPKAQSEGRFFPEQTRVAQLSATSYSNSAWTQHNPVASQAKNPTRRLPHMEPKARPTSPKYVPPPLRGFNQIPESPKRSYFKFPTTGRKTSMNTLRANTF